MKWSGLTAIGYTSTHTSARTLATLSVIGLMFYHHIGLNNSKLISFQLKLKNCHRWSMQKNILTSVVNASASPNKIFPGIECSRLTLNLFHVFALFSFCEWHKKYYFFLILYVKWKTMLLGGSKNSSSILHSNQKIWISFLNIF